MGIAEWCYDTAQISGDALSFAGDKVQTEAGDEVMISGGKLMRKRIISPTSQDTPVANQHWLNLEALADVEVTSEDAAHPIESALVAGAGRGWRAEEPGPQTVRLLFHEPQRIQRVNLLFQENERERTQQFVLRWSADAGQSYREIVRQQYNFSQPDTISESEEYTVALAGVTALELSIIPDISGGTARASLAHLRLA
ncbi:MAG TPA: hypothetical protein VHM64_01690 [Candidatus Binatia bacterium]|nr:hypothetical protein [Candidatus Binatia bacterium]